MQLKYAEQAPQEQSSSDSRQYIYCIIAADGPLTFASPCIGGGDFTVHTINYQELAAVVSESPAPGYESTKRNMTAHMKVLEEVMRSRTILPIRFNSISPCADAVRDQVLVPSYDTLKQQLAKFEGHIEMGVKAFWREDVLYNEIVAANDDIRRLRDRIAGRSPEATYRERVKLGEMVENALEAKRASESEAIIARLKSFAADMVVREPLNERMALNAALFMKASDREEFEEALNALDAEEDSRMTFKCVGPVPPYNFVEVMLGSQ
ncbi:MAG: GvpL/GvpF family gas vesicle protein [Alphaproteobacteria bacterium]